MSSAETIVRLAARGDGVSESGRFIAFAAPGDRVDSDGRIEAGPHHQLPPCRHFPECGGCQLQHVDDVAYSDFLKDRIVSALSAQQVPIPEIREPHLSPPRVRRRASLRAQRLGGQVQIGFNAQASHRIVDMRECQILHPELFALVAPLRTLLRHRLGPRSACEVRMTLADQGVDLLLRNLSVEGLEAAEAIAAFATKHRLARLSVDDGYGPQDQWEPEPVTVTLSGISVPLVHDSFLQATADGEQALVEAVREATDGATVIADLFAGLGTFALSLSGRSLPGRILAVEGARDPAAALKLAVNRARKSVFVDHRDLFRRPLDVTDLDRFEAVVLDPPRAGAKEQVVHLARSSVGRIAYVSCNPATFARDSRTLIDGGYALSWIQPVGQFRWSTHVELAASFARQA